MKPTRIYVVIDSRGPSRWLVRAINPHVALKRVIAQRFVSRVASQDELVRLTNAGVEVQHANPNPEPDLDDLFEPVPAEEKAADNVADVSWP